jgi:mono/diheme cytochrome c family protein
MIMLRKTMFVVGLMSLMLALLAGTALAQGGGDPVKGKTLWEQRNCKSCHGLMGEGKYAGPRAGDGKSAADWIKQVRTPRQNMPAFDVAHISDAEITDMNAYMQTLPKPTSFTPLTFVAGPDDLPGKVLFHQKRCVACHGDPVAFLTARFTSNGRTITNEAVIKQLRTPAKFMPMFNPTQVTDAQAGQIADFFRSLVGQAAPAAPAPVTLPVAGGQNASAMLPGLLVVIGLAFLGIGVGLTVAAKRRA